MQQYTIDDLANGVRNSDRRMLAKAISLIESSKIDDFLKSQELVERLLPYTGNSYRIGITGVPGVGKSTFIEAWGQYLVQQNKRLAILAIDPSSQRSGGSILGDKTRMLELSRLDNVFIRPSPSGGTLGGVARKTRETMLLCEAAGFDTILIETVGVGQSEATVASMVDFLLVLLLPNAGDELQGIKRGIMEIADCFLVNKADGEQKPFAELTAHQIKTVMHFFFSRIPEWTPPVLTCSAYEKTGLSELWDIVLQFFSNTERIKQTRIQQNCDWMHALLEEKIKNLLYNNSQMKEKIATMEKLIAMQQKSPSGVAYELMQDFASIIANSNELQGKL